MFSPFDSLAVAVELTSLALDAAWKGCVVLSVALLAVRGMKKRSAAARHLTLFSAVACLLLIPLLSSILPQWHRLPSWMAVAAAKPMSQSDPEFATSPGQILPVTAEAASQGTFLQDSDSFVPASRLISAYEKGWTVREWLLAAWLAGVFCVLAPAVIGIFSLARLERESRVVSSGPLWKLLQHLSAKIGLRREVVLLTTEHRRMPMTWSVLHPKVLLPEGADEWPVERQKVVLLHELAHVRRCDALAHLLTQLTCAVYWFNPLVWYAARQIKHEQEQACDDVVLGEGAKPTSYAEELLQIAAGRTDSCPEPFGAMAMARPSSLEGRLLAILDGTQNRKSVSRAGIFLAGFLATLVVVPASILTAASTTARTDSNEIDRGLVAWWRGEENGKDSTGSHHGKFPFGGKTGEGLVGEGFDFQRSNAVAQIQRVSIPDSPEFQLSETLTLEAWIYPRQYGGIVLLRGDDRGGLDTWHMNLMIEGLISFGFNDDDNQATAIQAPIQLNQWQHVAATFEHGAMRIYINGILMAQGNTELRPIAVLDAAYDPALGIGNAGGKVHNAPFDGIIDEVRIYNRALSEAEIGDRLKQ